MNDIKRITILKGGWSPEREISLQSGAYVASIFRSNGFDVYEIDVKKDLLYLTNELYKSNPDYIYNALHGIGGEDGVIQGVLEVFGKPYSNSNVLSSSICFNKQICKTLVNASGVNTVPGCCILSSNIKNINTIIGISISYPFIIKPASNGSSIGVFLINNESDLNSVKSKDWIYGNEVIIERYISGREFTVAVINGDAIGALEITSSNIFYDFDSKYSENGSNHISNYDLDKRSEVIMFKYAEIAYKACHCSGIARVDFRYDGQYMYFLEINTQPGMTSKSLVPDILRNNNIKLVENIIV
ncbi:MAG: D-alanine--D-alanine ligase [Alphaproteobacteria bacterium]|nr:D-alanine--D-alanine ligase [Alphaproteobacteria bacterium]